MAFDRAARCSYGNDFAQNLKTFGDDNIFSIQTKFYNDSFFLLNDGPTDTISDTAGTTIIGIIDDSAIICAEIRQI